MVQAHLMMMPSGGLGWSVSNRILCITCKTNLQSCHEELFFSELHVTFTDENYFIYVEPSPFLAALSLSNILVFVHVLHNHFRGGRAIMIFIA